MSPDDGIVVPRVSGDGRELVEGASSDIESRIVMSIYATLWYLQFPRYGDAHLGCEWVGVFAQGVPAFIGTPTAGYGYESGDPFDRFLPPALRIGDGVSEDDLRAVLFVGSESKKGTTRSGQEYDAPLLTLTGAEYAATPFQVLYERLCDALRGNRPQLVLEVLRSDSTSLLVFGDGSTDLGKVDAPADDH